MDAGTIIGVTATAVGLVYAFLRNFKNDINSKIDRLDSDVRTLSAKLDADTRAQTERTDQQSARTDQLYQMFIDLLKSQTPKTNP